MATNGTVSMFKRQRVQVGQLLTDEGVGTVTTPTTTRVEELGHGDEHVSKFTLTSFAMGTVPDNAALAIGGQVYTFPAGTIIVTEASIVGGVTSGVSVTAQTPEVGLGTTTGTGAAATLSGTMEDFIDGGAAGGVGGDTVAPNLTGGAFYKTGLHTMPIVIKTTGGKAREVWLNAAATWADVTSAGTLAFTGVVTVKWRKVS